MIRIAAVHGIAASSEKQRRCGIAAGVRHHRDDRHIQLPVRLHTFYAGHEADLPRRALPKIAAVFSAFILFETWPMPVAGYFVDKLGIRRLMMVGAACIGLGWVLGGTIAKSPVDLYLYYGVIAGTGAGIIYISCVANAVKWFPDRRGLAVGLTAAGFGGGAALTVIPIASTIHSMGWAKAMAVWGIAQGVIAFGAAIDTPSPPSRLGACRVGPEHKAGTQGRGAVEGEFYLDPNSSEAGILFALCHVFLCLCWRVDSYCEPFTNRQIPPCERCQDLGSRDCSAGRHPDSNTMV